MAVRKKNKIKEEELIMRMINRLFPFRLVIAFAAVLLIGGVASADITGLDFASVDLQKNRTEVKLTVSAVCSNNTDTENVTVYIYQSVGRLVMIGTGASSGLLCTGGTDNLDITVSLPGGNLKFQPGPATLYISGYTSTTDPTTHVTTTSPIFEIGDKINLH